MITEISVSRLNNFDDAEMNLILHFIYVALFIVIETRPQERRRLLVDRPCNYACIKIYERHRARQSSAFIEDSSRPGRGQDITHQMRNARSRWGYNDLTTKLSIKYTATDRVIRVFIYNVS